MENEELARRLMTRVELPTEQVIHVQYLPQEEREVRVLVQYEPREVREMRVIVTMPKDVKNPDRVDGRI